MGDKIYNYKTKYKEGFTASEIKDIISGYKNFNMEKFEAALKYRTVRIINGEIITYHNDLITAIKCGVENRDLRQEEWD